MASSNNKGTSHVKRNSINREIGNRLLKWRTTHRYSQTAFLQELNDVEEMDDVITASTYSRYESGQVTIGADFLYRLDKRFGDDIDVTYIVTGKKVPEYYYRNIVKRIETMIAEVEQTNY